MPPSATSVCARIFASARATTSRRRGWSNWPATPEVLREIAARHGDDVEAADFEDVVQRVDARERLDQQDVEHGVVRGLQVVEVREAPAQRRVGRPVAALARRARSARRSPLASASSRVAICGNTTPSAPQSSACFTSSGRTPGTRTSGVDGRAARRRDHRRHRLDADRRVLGVDHQPVDARARERLHDLHARPSSRDSRGSGGRRRAFVSAG